MKKGDFIIWDSRFGYDIGFYSNEKGVMYNTCEIYLITGISSGRFSASHHEVKPFTKELVEELNERYTYKNSIIWTYENLIERLNIRQKEFLLNE